MTVTKEMIEAAKAETAEEVLGLLTAHELYQYRPKAFQGFIDYVRKHFAAASLPRSAEAGKPVVKGLEWHTTEDVTQNTTGICHYKIEHFSAGGFGVYLHGYVGLHGNPLDTLEAAKAAAQADYEARILAALSTPADIEPVAWRYVYDDADGVRHRGCSLEKPTHHNGYPVLHLEPLYAAPVADGEPVSVPEGWHLVRVEDLEFCVTAIAKLQEHKARLRLEQMISAAAPQPNPSAVDAELVEGLKSIIADGLKECDRSQRPSYAWQLRARAALAAQGEKP